jgi:hypothetical protein
MTYTTHGKNHIVSYRTTTKVVRNINNRKRKTKERDPPPQN